MISNIGHSGTTFRTAESQATGTSKWFEVWFQVKQLDHKVHNLNLYNFRVTLTFNLLWNKKCMHQEYWDLEQLLQGGHSLQVPVQKYLKWPPHICPYLNNFNYQEMHFWVHSECTCQYLRSQLKLCHLQPLLTFLCTTNVENLFSSWSQLLTERWKTDCIWSNLSGLR